MPPTPTLNRTAARTAWRPIPSAPHYDLHPTGTLRSWRHGRHRLAVPREKAPRSINGVRCYGVTVGGKATTRTVESLLRETFGGDDKATA